MVTLPIAPPDAHVLAPLGPGWRPVEPPTPLEMGGTFTALRIASGAGVLLVLCEATVPGALPSRGARLRIRRRIEERAGEVVVVFSDSIRAATVWSLPPEPVAGVPAEFHLPGLESALPEALRALLARRAGTVVAAHEEAMLATLISARLPGHPAGGVTIGESTMWVHRHASRGQAQRSWRALSRLALLDPSCGEGEWLEAAGSTLLPLHISTLRRVQADADDLIERDVPNRDSLHTIRPLLEALQECSGDTEAFARRTLCRRTLHGLTESPSEARAARRRLASFAGLPEEIRTPLDVRVKVVRPGVSREPAPAIDHEGWVLERARRLLEAHRAGQPGDDPGFRRAALSLERRERRWTCESNDPWADRTDRFDFERPR